VTRDFVDSIFGDGATERIVGNIRSITDEVGRLLTDFQANADTASNTALAALLAVQVPVFALTSAFKLLWAHIKITYDVLSDFVKLHAYVASKIGGALGITSGEYAENVEFKGPKGYLEDYTKNLEGPGQQLMAMMATVQAMGNQSAAFKTGAAQPIESAADAQALLGMNQNATILAPSRYAPVAPITNNTDVKQHNEFYMAPGSTQAQAKEVAAAVDHANKQSYRAAEANLVHTSEGG
jgi:hypothetical protein